MGVGVCPALANKQLLNAEPLRDASCAIVTNGWMNCTEGYSVTSCSMTLGEIIIVGLMKTLARDSSITSLQNK